ncbi:MAG TPA: PIG-L deacetylase family protein [Acidobacteriota bacterium]|nr:PIG-L deacetylase family protein [Acidobacteriota bacterium]
MRTLLIMASAFLLAAASMAQERLEEYKNKTILVFSPHPDDDSFAVGGTLALLTKNGNRIIIAIYTNDDKGSFDQEMTSERLARIRKSEEEAACAVLGIPAANIIWMGHDDGELEYVPPKYLCGQATKIIRQYRPDAVLSVDPGEWYGRWHKTDHRMAASNSIDAIRAAEFHLYYPEHLLVDRLQPYKVRNMFFYYAAPQDANYFVNIDSVFEKKMEAASKHVSQFEPAASKYRPDWNPADLSKLKEEYRREHEKKDGHYVESFRYSAAFNEK